MTAGKFGTAINCIDGRVQEPLIAWLKAGYGLDYVDLITEAGPDRALATQSRTEVERIKRTVGFSVSTHGSEIVAVVGHHDCAGNPVSKATHWEQIASSVELVLGWGYCVSVVGLWIDEHRRVNVVTPLAG